MNLVVPSSHLPNSGSKPSKFSARIPFNKKPIAKPSLNADRSNKVIKDLYRNEQVLNSARELEESEVSGYDEVSIIQMDLHENDYRPIDTQYLDTEVGLICVIHTVTPLGFKCYVVSPSERHSSPTLEEVSPFLNEQYLEPILLKVGHKASGVAIRFGDKINFNWEGKSYNFRTNQDHSLSEEITPIITASQLQNFPTESLVTMHDLYRSIRSDQVIESDNRMGEIMLAAQRISHYPDIQDQTYDLLVDLKDYIDPIVATPSSDMRNQKLSELVNYREQIIQRMVSIARKQRLISELADEYDELAQLVGSISNSLN